MRSYDGRQAPDFMGSDNRKGKKGQGSSLLGEFMPDQVISTSMRQPSEIGRFKYPDTAEAIYDEQEGNVKMVEKSLASGKRRK